MKVFVLGASGMLGRYVSISLKEHGLDVVNVGRDEIDASRIINESSLLVALNYIGFKEDDYIINCMGTIKPRVDNWE